MCHLHTLSLCFFICSFCFTNSTLWPHSNFIATIHVQRQHRRKPIMALLSYSRHSPQLLLTFFLFLFFKGTSGATFTFVNKCEYTVWPGILGKPDIGSTGFELARGSSKSFQAPAGWSGRFWARTDCKFDQSGHGTCATGDCGSGQMLCNGAGATPPATLAEFTLGSSGSQDYYDVSLVDGFNLPMAVEASRGSGPCSSTGCVADLNRRCPSELRVEGGDACNSACGAFGKPEFCCNGEYGSPSTCKPSTYSVIFKSACPKSYSYAYDDATSTFTCTAADYTITFCPSSPSLKSTGSSPTGTDSSSGSSSVEEGALASTSWMADMATGAASTRNHDGGARNCAIIFGALSVMISFLVL